MRLRHTLTAQRVCFAALVISLLPACAATGPRFEHSLPFVTWTAYYAAGEGSGATYSAESWYAAATRLDREGSAAAVDAYLQCAIAAWPAVEMIGADLQGPASLTSPAFDAGVHDSREWELYHAAVAGLLTAAQKHGRWSPTTGLLAMGPHGLAPVETAYHGFLWAPTEFGALHPVGENNAAHASGTQRREGLGVPLFVVRHDAGVARPFVQPGREFAATALVRPVTTAGGTSVVLEFYDPLREEVVRFAGGAAPLARDISPPHTGTAASLRQAWLAPFLHPAGAGADDRLEMLEPYQAGKIPVLFVHGLLSDPLTWATMVSHLQSHPQIVNRYQIWTFGYDTGEPFLTSAAMLRRQLLQLQALYNPCGDELAARNIVIVGHSMGGLVANLQVTYSGETLWNAAARVPLEQIRTDAATRMSLSHSFYFDPSDNVSRVVYIGTPHLGSGLARRLVGNLGSALVEQSPLAEGRHKQLVRDNPDAFSEELTRRFPTSIDLLEPTSPILNATAQLPYRPGVITHSIIGEGRYTIGSGPSDGVVPVTSARLFGASSEQFVDVRHSHEPRNKSVIAEVLRILVLHAQGVDAACTSSTDG